jgi:hypothetical protein
LEDELMPTLQEALARWSEAQGRPGVMSASGWSIVVSFRKQVARYFLDMEKDMGTLRVPDNHYGMIEPHLMIVLRDNQATLLESYKAHGVKAFNLAGKHSVLREAGASIDTPDKPKNDLFAKLDRLGLTGQQAVDYVIAHGAELVKGIDAYTLKVMRSLIAQGIEEQKGVEGTVRLIRKEFKEMSTKRAQSIATTETNDAMSEATLQKIKSLGGLGKRWIHSPGACPICIANSAQGIIPVDAYFQSGHQRPPAHPGKCRCAIVGTRQADSN